MTSNFLQSVELESSIFDMNSLIVTHQDGQVNGSFVLQFLVSEFIRMAGGDSQLKVLLILNHQSTYHWASIATKLNWNIHSLKGRNQLSIIDTLQATYELLTKEPKSTGTESDLNISQSLGLDLLLSKTISEVDKLCGQRNAHEACSRTLPSEQLGGAPASKLLILLEDFTALLDCTGESEKAGLDFIRQLRFLREDLSISVATLVCSTESDWNRKYFCNLLSRVLATTSFYVNPLRTGFSSEVNGFLTVQEHDRVINDQHHLKRRPRSYNYRLLDRGIKLIPL